MVSRENSSRGWRVVMIAAGILSACGGSSSTPIPAAPSTSAEVPTSYAALGNACNSGFIQRGFNLSNALAGVQWSAPDSDPGAVKAMKRKSGWTPAVAVLELGSVGFAEDFTSTSALQAQQCGALREVLTPLSTTLPDGKRRNQHVSLLLYAEDHERPASIPVAGTATPEADAPIRVAGYLDVSSALEGEAPGVYSEVSREHLPVHVSCSRPLKAKIGYVTVDSADDLDPGGCTPSQNEPGKLVCMYEQLEHVAGNECSFVALGVSTRSRDNTVWWMSFGGKLTASSTEPVSYQLRVDRMVFHDAPAR